MVLLYNGRIRVTTIVSKKVLKIDDQEDNEKVDLRQRKLKKKR
jgi:hypothetical protein